MPTSCAQVSTGVNANPVDNEINSFGVVHVRQANLGVPEPVVGTVQRLGGVHLSAGSIEHLELIPASSVVLDILAFHPIPSGQRDGYRGGFHRAGSANQTANTCEVL